MTGIATETGAATSRSLISLLYAARGLRGFGDGFAIIILPAYMTTLGYDAIAVGLVATASLLGTALLTLIVGRIAARHDPRALMIFGASLMVATGAAFPGVEQFVLIALVAFVGTINLSFRLSTRCWRAARRTRGARASSRDTVWSARSAPLPAPSQPPCLTFLSQREAQGSVRSG